MRRNSASLNVISSDAAASRGDHSRSSAWYAGVFMLLVITPNSASTRPSCRPASCIGTKVFSKVAGSGPAAMAWISARRASMATRKASGKSSGRILSHGGTPP
jgi:hypothetical protein